MANWKARVRSAKKADRRVLNQQLEEIRQEAATAGRDLRFLFESNGRKMDIDPQATVESLTDVERHYRAVARDSGVSPEDLAMIERLMALLLGETLIRARGGRWDVYDGQFRTASPSKPRPLVLATPLGRTQFDGARGTGSRPAAPAR